MGTVLRLPLPSAPRIGSQQIMAGVERMFAPDGLLVKAGREHRPGQLEFATRVAECLANKRSGLLEAACGVGKAFGILAPAIIAASLGKRVVIAVSTNALIEQLRADAPVVMKMLGIEIPWASVKGRANSLCAFRAEQTREHFIGGRWQGRGAMSAQDNVVLGNLLRWAENPENVDLTQHEQTLSPRVRRLVTIDADDCRSARRKRNGCEYGGSKDERTGEEITPCRCAFLISRNLANEANLVITNFSVLLWNYKSAGGMIGVFDHIILDEVQDFAAVVRDFSTQDYSLSVFEKLITLAHDTPSLSNGVSGITVRLSDSAQHLDTALREFAIIPQNHRDKFYETLLDPPGAARMRLVEIATRLLAACDELYRAAVAAHVPGERLDELDKRATVRRLLDALGGPTGAANESNFAISLNVGPLDQNPPTITLRVVPVHLGGHMRATIHYSSKREQAVLAAGNDAQLVAAAILANSASADNDANVICVSATLTPDGTWDHPMRQFAMPRDTVTCQVSSPFDYEKNAIWYVPRSMPSPSGSREARDEYNKAASVEAERLVLTTGGRTLVLCSRRDDMEVARRAINGLGFAVFMQDDAPPRELARRFRNDPTSCLIGSRTFGTGFDVPGGALECVIVWRLPYPHPGPVDELLKRRLGSSKWMNLVYTPEMLLAYRQWIGRAIRQTTDIGVIAMLDSGKLLTIGKQVRGAMPEGIRLVRDISEVDEFLKKHRSPQ